MNNFDVIVIGGGPSGLQTSNFLSEKGLDVALFEKESNIGENVVCSGVISKEAFLRYDLPHDSISGKLQEAELNSPSSKKIVYKHPEESVVVVDRNKFDSLLAKKSQKSGTNIYLNSKVISLDSFNNFVEAKISVKGQIKSFRSKIAVIATGVSFNLQTQLGMGRPKQILKGIQVELDEVNIEKLQMYWGNNYSKGFFGWVIPLFNNRAKIGVMTKGNSLNGLNNILTRAGLPEVNKIDRTKIKRRGISFGSIKRKYSDRILAVGEAAGFVKTTTGGGIYYGLISSEIATQVIMKAFMKNKFDESTLSEYETLSKNEFSRELKFGEYFHRFYSVLNDEEINLLFDAAKEDNLLSYISKNGEFDWHRDTVIRILKSPHIRKVLLKGFIKQGVSRLAYNN